MKNKITIKDLLDYVENLTQELDVPEPETVEDLDEQIHFPHPEEDDDCCEAEGSVELPKWRAADFRILDIINNTLSQKAPISQNQAETLLTLAAVRETICRYQS